MQGCGAGLAESHHEDHEDPVLNLKLPAPAMRPPRGSAKGGLSGRRPGASPGCSFPRSSSSRVRKETVLGDPLGKVKSNTQQVGAAQRKRNV